MTIKLGELMDQPRQMRIGGCQVAMMYNTFLTRAHLFTETKKHSPNTGARANNTLHK